MNKTSNDNDREIPSTNRNVDIPSNKRILDDEIQLQEIIKAIIDGRYKIIVITIIFGLFSIVYSLSIPNQYKTTLLLEPTASSNISSLSKLANQFSGLSSLAGISLGGIDGDDKTTLAIEIIKTWGFLDDFIIKNNLEVPVYASKGWDELHDKLIIDDDIYDDVNKIWVRDFDPDKGETAKPSSWELFEVLSEYIHVTKNLENGLVYLSVEFYSPRLSKDWALIITQMINDYFRERDLLDARKNIEYLQQQVNKTEVSEMQNIFYNLIEEHTKTIMLAEVSEEYVFKILNKPMTSEEKSKPNRAMICVLITLFGFMTSLIYAIRSHFTRS